MTKEELLELKQQVLSLGGKVDGVKDLMPKMSAYSYMYDCNKDRLDCLALNYLGRTMTFREFFEKIDITAKALVERFGVKENDVVSMCMLNTPEGIITFYALNKIGALVHMINIANSKEDITRHLINTNSKTFITMDIFYSNEMEKAISEAGVENVLVSSLTDSLPLAYFNSDKAKFKLIGAIKKVGNAVSSDKKCIRWNEFQKIGRASKINVTPTYQPNRSVAIAYTSGSTGEAKAVVTTDEAMNAMPVQMGMTDQTFAPNDSIFTTLPLWIYYSLVNNVHDPLCLGVSLDLDPLFDSKKIAKRLRQYRFNHWNTIPAYVEDMANSRQVQGLNLSHLKSITTGGDYLTTTLKNRADQVIRSCNATIGVGQGYGASELLGSFGYTYEKEYTVGSIGKPLVGNSFKILDLETMQPLGVDQVGELYLYSPTIMKEYYKNPDATDESLVEDENGIVWYRTGDLAHYNANNELFIDGRIRRIVMAKDDKGLPTKIFPDKIKRIILQSEYVEKCEIITVDDSKYIKRPVAYIVLKENVVMTSNVEKSIQRLCIESLERYTQPSEYKFVEQIPLTAGLKPNISALEKMYAEENDHIKRK